MIYSNSVCCLGYVLDDREIRAQFPTEEEQSLQTYPGDPFSLLFIVYQGLFPSG